MSKQKLIDVIQWILIIGLSIVLLIGFIRQNEAFTKNADYEKNNTYVKIYESQNISKLKKENKALYDSIKKLKNVGFFHDELYLGVYFARFSYIFCLYRKIRCLRSGYDEQLN